jgi:hypothetical protein
MGAESDASEVIILDAEVRTPFLVKFVPNLKRIAA